jgi:hypothetical protein
MWPTLVAALSPFDLAEPISCLPNILIRFARLDADGNYLSATDRSRPHQIADFRSRFSASIQHAA